MRNRKLLLGKIGAVLLPLAGVAAVFWPQHADTFRDLAVALAALLASVAGTIAYEDGKQADARAMTGGNPDGRDV